MRFSIVIPVFNASELVKISIDSLKSQTFEDFEVILVDDGSTDDSYNIISELIINDNRFKILRQINGGPGCARNAGINISTGDFIGFLDADDYFHCDYLMKVNKSIVNNSTDIVVSDFLKVDISGKIIKKYVSNLYGCITGMEGLRYILRSEKITSMSQNKVFRRELFADVTFPGDILVNEDSSTLFKLFHKSRKVSFVNEFLFYYVQHPSSTMNSFSKKKLMDRIVASKIVSDYLDVELDINLIENDYIFYYFLNVIFSGTMQVSLQSEQAGKDMKFFMSNLKDGMFSFSNIYIICSKYKAKGALLFILKLSPMLYIFAIKLIKKVDDFTLLSKKVI
jgi:glycosyltransferase involved in cell wall biosynthesis